ncbi:DUF881 domain-containing protein [Thalassobacillus pellis]|uniref:DUF881 domain-containing protein n=1 Tax=Thalassobacillus pellis TaxID=748008 RepID=UPI001960CA04|nr:DUF881 domain-containing protein [Thalassobacillus pellis]MBM7552847.1 uncharacterized protein YlxW (UPF0749 family) [Thalassobacillus pellis]
MKNQTKWIISVIFGVVGFMIAIQFQTANSEPELRDTRDQWEIRQELQKQQKIQQELLQKISKTDRTLEDYKETSDVKKKKTLQNTIEQLEKKAGLTDLAGSGIKITLEPIFQELEDSAAVYPALSPELLARLINELNTYGAEGIAIENERLISLSPIRNVNGQVYVNNRPLKSLPVEIYVIAHNPKKLLDYVQASPTRDFFAMESIGLTAELSRSITLPKYDDPLNLEEIRVHTSQETGEA